MPSGSRTYRLQSYGVPYDITVDPAAISYVAVRPVVPPFTRVRRGGAASRRYRFSAEQGRRTIAVDDEPPVPFKTIRDAQDLLEGDLALHVASTAQEHIFIHAGVVGWRGRALLLPGRTMTGKSTLVNALVARGATYYSDEYAVLDERGLVTAYPRRMSLRRSKGLPRRVLPGKVGRRALPIAWVLGSRFEVDRERVVMESLSPGRIALLLLDNAVAARLEPARVLRAVRQVSEGAEGGILLRGDARTAAKQLLLLLTPRGILKPVVS